MTPLVHKIRIGLAALLLGSAPLMAQQSPENAAAAAMELFNAGQYKEAATAYETVVKNYPTSPMVPVAQFQLGYIYYVLGDYTKSIEFLKKILQPPAPAEIQELGQGLLPQSMAAAAGKLPENDPKRRGAFEEAIAQYDVFLKKYPRSTETENIVYSRSLSLFQIGKYDDTVAGLRSNLARFGGSASILDSQYLLALTLATQANQAAGETGVAGAAALYDEAEKLLNAIVQKGTDVALANDAQLQVGEILNNRAAYSDEKTKKELYSKAMEAYRKVQPKDMMIKSQEARINAVLQRIRGTRGAVGDMQRLQRLREREQTKLQAIRDKPDQVIVAKIKMAQIYVQQQRFDEARVLLRYLGGIAEEAQQEEILYYTILTYASQKIVSKAEEHYQQFVAKYKNATRGENLPIVMASLYLSEDPKINNPPKAIEYLEQGIASYPNSRFLSEMYSVQASALVQLKEYDKALEIFKKLLESKPKREVAAAAELGIATVQSAKGDPKSALATYRKVVKEFPGTLQAQEAAFSIGRVTMESGDPKTAIQEFRQFQKEFPNSEKAPTVLFYLAEAQLPIEGNDAALATFQEVATKYPQSPAASFSYFRRAALYAGSEKPEEMVRVMHEFIERYPEDEKIFNAYDTIGQQQVNAGQVAEAIATYQQMVDKQPNHPQVTEALLKISNLWKYYTESQGRYMALNEQQRAEWNKGVSGSIAAAEKLIQQYPESAAVALALQNLLAVQKMRVTAGLATEADIEKYFNEFSQKFADKPGTQSKILFTLASFVYEKDKAKGLEQMRSAYKPDLVYAPGDIDLYGTALLEQKQPEEALKLYEKLVADYPLSPGVEAAQAPVQVQEAQSIALYGIGKAYQLQGKTQEGAEKFRQLKQLYGWSPKVVAAEYGIAQSLFEQKKYDEATTLIVQIVRSQNAPADLIARAMLLGGKVQEASGNLESAIDYYIKIAVFYEAIPDAAAEGLWRGGQLLEKQAAGE